MCGVRIRSAAYEGDNDCGIAVSDGDLNPRDAIVPLFSVREQTPVEFLGTGSIVGDGSILLTAEHVISAWPPDSLRIGVLGRGMFEVSVIGVAVATERIWFSSSPWRPVAGSPNGQLFRNERCVAICDDVF
jgi:hypothetical protein